MTIILLVAYILIFVCLIVSLAKNLKAKNKKNIVFLYEIIAILFSRIIARYYDGLPGYGMMPGLTYFGEVLVSIGAMFLYGILLVITIILKIFFYLINKRKSKNL